MQRFPKSSIKLERCHVKKQAISHLFGGPPKRFKDLACTFFSATLKSLWGWEKRVSSKQHGFEPGLNSLRKQYRQCTLEHLCANHCGARNVLLLLWHHSSELKKKKRKEGNSSSYLGIQKLRGLWQVSILVNRPTLYLWAYLQFWRKRWRIQIANVCPSFPCIQYIRRRKSHNHAISHTRWNKQRNA